MRFQTRAVCSELASYDPSELWFATLVGPFSSGSELVSRSIPNYRLKTACPAPFQVTSVAKDCERGPLAREENVLRTIRKHFHWIQSIKMKITVRNLFSSRVCVRYRSDPYPRFSASTRVCSVVLRVWLRFSVTLRVYPLCPRLRVPPSPCHLGGEGL